MCDSVADTGLIGIEVKPFKTNVKYNMNKRFFYFVVAVIITMSFVACEKEDRQSKNSLVGKWLTSSYHTGDNDTIVFTENFYVQHYLDYIFANQVVPAMYLSPFVTYSVLGNNITFTIHYSYPSVENFDETFEYVLDDESLTIKGFSNPFSLTLESRSDVYFTKIK